MTLVHDFRIESESIGSPRMVSVYLPPGAHARSDLPVIFCADGQTVREFSHILHREITLQNVPSTVLVGVHSHEYFRDEEYLNGIDSRHFESHERFFTDEVYSWAKSEFNLDLPRRSCGVFGFSNGGTFAMSMGVRHREKYGVVIAFSIAERADMVPESEYERRPVAKYYLSAGTREMPFCTTVRAISKTLSQYGVENVKTERSADHDIQFWATELPEAVRWSFQHISTDT